VDVSETYRVKSLRRFEVVEKYGAWENIGGNISNYEIKRL
jgi:hypothetical protein